MKHVCLAAVVLVLPLAASAQDRRAERRSENHQSEQRQHDQRRADDRTTAQPPASNALPPWERQQIPWWERQGPPSWEQPITSRPNVPSPSAAAANAALIERNERLRRSIENGPIVVPNHSSGRRHYESSTIYVLPTYPYVPNNYPPNYYPNAAQIYAAPPPTAPPAAAMGALQLDVEPRALLQVFVDGNFVGTSADLRDQIELTPGTHRIELRARGYRTLIFNVDILANRSITYRGELERLPAPEPTATPPAPPEPPKAPAASGPKAIYVIPGCYLGNVAPKASELRAGCDISKMTTVSP